MKHRHVAVFCAAALAASCGKDVRVALPPPTPARVGAVETGVASWYGKPYHGRPTSNGEIYDMRTMTAAHLSLPFDTIVRVTNLANGRSADVRINDRGPFLKDRVIDVSRAAGERLGMIGTGTARVRVEVIAAPGAEATPVIAAPAPDAASCDGATIGVQVGSFRDRANAERTLKDIAARYSGAQIVVAETPAGALHRVVVGAADAASAKRTLDRLDDDGIDGFVTRFESNSPCFSAGAS